MSPERMITDLGPFPETAGYGTAVELDAADPLAGYRSRFVNDDPDLIYLDGNSLGRLPHKAIEIVDDTVRHQWGDRLIRSWNEGWWELQLELGEKLAPILGASPGEVIISDSTSVNLFKLAWAAVKSQPGKTRIVTDDLNFSGDVHVLDGVARILDAELVVVPSDGVHGPVEALAETIDGRTALVSLSHTSFKSSYTYDLAEITRLAHEAGALILWDASHSAGAVPIDLTGSGADLAVGCTYKYLNGGPGSPAFLYVRRDLQDRMDNPITAWWGHADPFSFDLDFEPVGGIRRFHTGTMPTLSLAAIEAGIDDVLDAGIGAIRKKSLALSEYLIDQWRNHLEPLVFGLASPLDSVQRGSHVSLSHDEAWPITTAMIEVAQVLPDFRAPHHLRLGLSPLYTTFTEVHTAVQRTKRLVENGVHHEFRHATSTVT